MTLNQGYAYAETVAGAWRGRSVLAYLSSRHRHSSEDVWKARLGNGEISLNGLRVGPEAILIGGERLVWQRPPWDEPLVPLDYALLHEDECMLAVAKPSGLPTIPAGGFLEHTLLALVRRRDPHATPVHRLGRGTSGIVLFARSPTARSRLTADFRDNRITKVYRALASGRPSGERFAITAPIGPLPHPRLGTIHGACEHGKPSWSEVRVLQRHEDASIVEVRIRTGRPHQIRIHLAAAGHPLVGDPLYPIGGRPRQDCHALPGETGYRLHAERLKLHHPLTDTPLEIWCAPPPDLRT